MNFDELAVEHRRVFDEIYENQYYLETFDRICQKFGGAGESFGLQDPEKINSFWNAFWYDLPDNVSIHRKPFYSVCDLAEGSYLEELCHGE